MVDVAGVDNDFSPAPLDNDSAGAGPLAIKYLRTLATQRYLFLTVVTNAGDIGLTGHERLSLILRDAERTTSEQTFRQSDARHRALEDQRIELEQRLFAKGQFFAHLAECFELEAEELKCIVLATALELSPELGLLIEQMSAGEKVLTEDVLRRLLDLPAQRIPRGCAASFRWQLLSWCRDLSDAPRELRVDPAVLIWVSQPGHADPEVVEYLKVRREPSESAGRKPLPLPASWPLECWRDQAADRLSDFGRLAVEFRGGQGSGRRLAAEAVARQLSIELLEVSSPESSKQAWSSTTALRIHRQARFSKMGLLWAEPRPAISSDLVAGSLEFIVCGPEHINHGHAADPAVLSFEVPPPCAEEFSGLWAHCLPRACPIEGLARVAIGPGEAHILAQRGLSDIRDARESLRSLRRRASSGLTRVMSQPYTWRDLVVSEKTESELRNLVHEAEVREQMRGMPGAVGCFPAGPGLLALFWGPPGTGKTMASRVLAHGLQRELHCVDAASVVSKYIGETSSNIRKLFREFRNQDAILLFDEADSIFGQRTEVRHANDRYANADTNYLLQAVEDYPGIIILATNRRADLDAALARRIRYNLEFAPPDVDQRRRLWATTIAAISKLPMPPTTPGIEVFQRAPNLDFLQVLSENFSLSGAQIKSAVFSAWTAAHSGGTQTIEHRLVYGLAGELARTGQFLSNRDRTRLLAVGSD